MVKWSVRWQQAKHVAKCSAPVVAFAVFGMEASHAAATYDIADPLNDISAGKAPVGSAAAATMGLLAIRRTWKIIRSSI